MKELNYAKHSVMDLNSSLTADDLNEILLAEDPLKTAVFNDINNYIKSILPYPSKHHLLNSLRLNFQKIASENENLKDFSIAVLRMLARINQQIAKAYAAQFAKLRINKALLALFRGILQNSYQGIVLTDLFKVCQGSVDEEHSCNTYSQFLLNLLSVIDQKIWPTLSASVKNRENIQLLSLLFLREMTNLVAENDINLLDAISKLKNLKLDFAVADPDNNGFNFLHVLLMQAVNSPIHFAYLQQVLSWLEKNNNLALINGLDNYKRSPLLLNVLLVNKNQIFITQKLLQLGALPNTVNNLGNTPLHYAMLLGLTSVTQLLLQNHACPNIQNKSGCNPSRLLEKLIKLTKEDQILLLGDILHSACALQDKQAYTAIIESCLEGCIHLYKRLEKDATVSSVEVEIKVLSSKLSRPFNKETVTALANSQQKIFIQFINETTKENSTMQDRIAIKTSAKREFNVDGKQEELSRIRSPKILRVS